MPQAFAQTESITRICLANSHYLIPAVLLFLAFGSEERGDDVCVGAGANKTYPIIGLNSLKVKQHLPFSIPLPTDPAKRMPTP
jgi:hypothetical protein